MSEPSLPPPSWPAGSSSAPPPPPGGRSETRPRPSGSVEPPPPPPPPSSDRGDWAAPDATPPRPPGGSRGESDHGPEPRRSRAGLVVALVAVVLVVVGGVAVALLGGSGQDTTTAADRASRAPADDAPNEGGAPGPGGTTGPAAPTDDGDLSPEAAEAHRELFAAIDASERAMIALSGATPVATGDLDDQELAEFEAQATAYVAELERIRTRLEDLDTAGDPDVAAIRDDYLPHLQDWIDWGTAVGSDPTLVDRPEAAGPYFDAINFSADGFASSVERNLDRDTAPGDVVDLADEIIERGFTGDDGGTEI